MEQQEFDAFSVFFWENSVRVGEQTYPLGQATVDVLNYPAEEFSRLCDLTEAFGRAYDRLLDQRDKRMAEDVQSKFNAALDAITTLPPYRDLKLDAGSRTFLLDLREMPEEWDESMRPGSEANRMFRELGAKVVALPERVNNFRGQVALMLEFFFEDLPRRSSSEYGRAFDDYYRAMIEGGARFYPAQEFEQSFPAEFSFVPMRHPDKPDEFFVAERAKFGELHFFLYTDFYRALAHGNAPRRCHNCGRYFLLTRGYNTCYCNNIAPGETTRTCRKVGAHAKEKREREEASPVQREYQRTYNRLKQQHQRRKKDDTEYNRQVAQAQDIRDAYARGALGEEDAIARLIAIK